MMRIQSVDDLLASISIASADVDISTSGTMLHYYNTEATLLTILKICNEYAYNYLTNIYQMKEKAWKERYADLQQTPIWKIAKKTLLNIFSDNEDSELGCHFCNEEIIYNRAVLHHNQYIASELFNPKLVQFMHYKCHKKYHKGGVAK